MTDNDTDDETEPTFDLTLEDVTPEEIALLAGALGVMAQQVAVAVQRGGRDEGTLERISGLSDRLTAENREAFRHLFLEGDFEGVLRIEPEAELLDKLDLEVVGGEIIDAGDYTDIEVE